MSAQFRLRIGALLVAAGLAATSCEREDREFRDSAAAYARDGVETQTTLFAGPPPSPSGTASPYQENAWGISEGKRLFTAYNCTGCHAHGGGAIGPALMDDEWIYGYEPASIYSTIVEGRPNGMPSFGNKIPVQQVWQLVAYVQSMSGQVPIDALPGRSDHMRPHVPETITPYQGRRQTGHK